MPEKDKNVQQLHCVGRKLVHIPVHQIFTERELHQSKIQPLLPENCGKVTYVDLSHNKLTTLDGLEYFEQVEDLILDGNYLGDDIIFPYLPNLTTLSLNKNKIENLEKLLDQLSQNAPNLHYLSLLGNTACPNQLSGTDKDDEDYVRYRCYVTHRLSELKFLDSTPITKKERTQANKAGQFMKVIRPCSEDEECAECDDGTGGYHPLPEFRHLAVHAGSYGICKYRYSGKHSEGNRFILNSDL